MEITSVTDILHTSGDTVTDSKSGTFPQSVCRTGGILYLLHYKRGWREAWCLKMQSIKCSAFLEGWLRWRKHNNVMAVEDTNSTDIPWLYLYISIAIYIYTHIQFPIIWMALVTNLMWLIFVSHTYLSEIGKISALTNNFN